MDILHRTYDLKVYTKRFKPEEIKRDWSIISIAWAFNDEPAKCMSVSSKSPLNDYEVVKAFHEVLLQADYIVGHNMDAFDLKKFNTRAFFYNLQPLGHIESFDTLKIARKYFKFSSNKLSYVVKYAGLEHKDGSPDWEKVLNGDSDELAYVREYNKKDVEITRQAYHRMKAWEKNHADINVKFPIRDVNGERVRDICPVCQSSNTFKDGFRVRKTYKQQKHRCHDCYACFGSVRIDKPIKE
jgi:DNA polymerase III epsilon subunit-like protein